MIWHLLIFGFVSSLTVSYASASSNFQIACYQNHSPWLENPERDFIVLELDEPSAMTSQELHDTFFRSALDARFRLTRYQGVERTDPSQNLIEIARTLTRDQQRSAPLVADGRVGLGITTINFEDTNSGVPDNQRFVKFGSQFVIGQNSESASTLDFASRSFQRPFSRYELRVTYVCSEPEFYDVGFGEAEEAGYDSLGSDVLQ
jgi:hypothetical protein